MTPASKDMVQCTWRDWWAGSEKKRTHERRQVLRGRSDCNDGRRGRAREERTVQRLAWRLHIAPALSSLYLLQQLLQRHEKLGH